MYYVKDMAKRLRYWYLFLPDAQARADATPDHLAGFLHMTHPEVRNAEFRYDGQCEEF